MWQRDTGCQAVPAPQLCRSMRCSGERPASLIDLAALFGTRALLQLSFLQSVPLTALPQVS